VNFLKCRAVRGVKIKMCSELKQPKMQIHDQFFQRNLKCIYISLTIPTVRIKECNESDINFLLSNLYSDLFPFQECNLYSV